MFSKTIIGLVVICSLLGFYPQSIVSQELQISQMSLPTQINYFADLYGVDSRVVSKVIDCESNGIHESVGDGGRSKGIGQFQEATFLRMEKKLGEDLNYNSSYDQVKLLTYAISQGWGREWTTYRAIQNGGKYSFYSKQLKKHFTVYCK